MKTGCRTLHRTAGGIAAAALLCLSSGLLAADAPQSRLAGTHLSLHPQHGYLPTPLLIQDDAGLAFDLGGSEQPKLQLQLAQPLGIGSFAADGPGGLVLAGSSLNFAPGGRLSLSAGTQVSQARPNFTAVGSIHCENGTLDAMSYRASNCHFINGGSQLLSLGARYRVNDNVRAGIGVFQQEHQVAGLPYWAAPANVAPFRDPLTPSASALPGLGAADASLTGIDLEFELGYSTDTAGDMVLGVQLARVIDAQFNQPWVPGLGLGDWSIAEPVDSARLSFDWHKGSFGGGIQSYYRAPVEFLNREGVEGFATFDVYFSWRAPWNASVSVGASNVMNAGKQNGNTERPLADPFESIYGRIPYVRYKQDL